MDEARGKVTMSELMRRLQADYKVALRAREERKVSTLRLLFARAKNVAIEQRVDEVDEATLLSLIQKDQGDKNASPVCRQSDGVRNSDRKTGWIPSSPSAVRGRERAHNAMIRSLLIPRSRVAAAARGGRAPGQRPRRGGKPGSGRASGRPAASHGRARPSRPLRPVGTSKGNPVRSRPFRKPPSGGHSDPESGRPFRERRPHSRRCGAAFPERSAPTNGSPPGRRPTGPWGIPRSRAIGRATSA